MDHSGQYQHQEKWEVQDMPDGEKSFIEVKFGEFSDAGQMSTDMAIQVGFVFVI